MKEILLPFIKSENVDNFEDFHRVLVDNSKKFNLTSILNEEEVYVKHFIDSLYAKDLISENAKVVEVGSGGGFPSVPLKLERADIDFTLIEATEKKCAYLKEVGNRFNFKNFTVVNGRCEELGKNPDYREKYDFAIARAVAPLNILVEYLTPFLKVNGKALCLKGSSYEEELIKARNAISVLGCKVSHVKEYELPENYGKRAIVVIKKIKPTCDKYPRQQAKIKKAPL